MPLLESMKVYWADHPPLHVMVAAYLGIKPKGGTAQQIEEASEFVPVSTCSTSEFDLILQQHGLPVSPAA